MATVTRRRQKINRFDVQNNNFARAPRCLRERFFALVAQLQKVPICTFCGGRDHKTKTPFFFSWTLIQSLEFNFRKSRQRLMKWSRWNQRDEVWSSANTLLKWRSVRLLLISSLFRVSKHKSVFMEEKEILLILIRQFSTVSHPEQSRRNWLAIN